MVPGSAIRSLQPCAERRALHLKFDPAEYKQQQYDLLADTVRANLDMDLIYRIIERTA